MEKLMDTDKDVPPMAVVGGVPAKIIRYIENEE